MSGITYASKDNLLLLNEHNKKNFNHGYAPEEFIQLSDKINYPVVEIKKTRKSEDYKVMHFMLDDKGKFCVFYVNQYLFEQLNSMEIPSRLVN
tara:strand:+ start:794 stop:1072 length:279 start_codon:yes stop_codon:yes gene_type:complete